MSKPLLLTSGMALLIGIASHALAQTGGNAAISGKDSEAAAGPVEREAEQRDLRLLPLQDLLSPVDQLKLSGMEDEVLFQLHVPEGSKVDKATLHLGYVNSDWLSPEQSVLELSLNRELIARLPVTGNSRLVRGTIEIPPDWFRPGLNNLAFLGHQRHRSGCDVALQGEMWTEVDPKTSHIRIATTRTEAWQGLAMLDRPDWAWMPAGTTIQIMTTSPGVNLSMLETGALVAQAFSLRGGGWPVAFRHRRLGAEDITAAQKPADLGETDTSGVLITDGLAGLEVNHASQVLERLVDNPFGSHILIGLREELLPLLGAEIAEEIGGPYLAYLPRIPESAGGFLIVSGRTDQELRRAALRLADLEQPMPLAEMATVAPSSEFVRYRTPFIENDRVYRFNELGFAMSNDSRQLGTIYFQLPEDFFVADNRRAEMRLNFAYRPNLPPNTRLNILVNGEPADTVKLSNSAGELVYDERILLPLRSFRPGGNEITFEPVLGQGELVNCERLDNPGDWIEIFQTSTISVPPGASIKGQRDLNTVRSLGYPFADVTRPSPWLVLPSTDDQSVSAAWTLMSRLGQTAGAPIADLRATTAMPNPGAGDVILVAPQQLIDPGLLRASGLSGGVFRERPRLDDTANLAEIEVIARLGEEPVITLDGAQTNETPPWLGELESRQPLQAQARGWGGWSSYLTDAQSLVRGFLGQLASHAGIPLHQDRLFGVHDGGIALAYDGSSERFHVLIMTAANGHELQRAAGALVRPQVWDQLHGTAAGWVAEPPRVVSIKVSDPVTFAGLPEDPRSAQIQINNIMASNPERWLFASFALVLLVGFALRSNFTGDRDE